MATINGDNGPNELFGTASNDLMNGRLGDDVLEGFAGNDLLNGNEGDDILDGGEGADTLIGEIGNDQLSGSGGKDRLVDRAGKDTLNGEAGDDFLDGGLGDDVLRGGAGHDVLVGDEGSDRLIGGEGSTRYVYYELQESVPGDADRIVRFGADDRIDLTRIDLDPIRFLDDRAFTGEGDVELRLDQNASNVTVQVDADGDRQSDFEILVNAQHLGRDDFLL